MVCLQFQSGLLYLFYVFLVWPSFHCIFISILLSRVRERERKIDREREREREREVLEGCASPQSWQGLVC